tara:strand:+ start:3289 stop:3420 length:132 start_codon:yes stop_codon:yes gene_type:complete
MPDIKAAIKKMRGIKNFSSSATYLNRANIDVPIIILSKKAKTA